MGVVDMVLDFCSDEVSSVEQLCIASDMRANNRIVLLRVQCWIQRIGSSMQCGDDTNILPENDCRSGTMDSGDRSQGIGDGRSSECDCELCCDTD